MTPKEKARELFEKMLYSDVIDMTNECAKLGALLAVNEIIKETPTEILDTYKGETNFIINDRLEYWKKVKKEVGNL